MKLLFDQNLSRRLVRSSADIYSESAQVIDVGVDREDDRFLWDYARSQAKVVEDCWSSLAPHHASAGVVK